MSLTAETPVRAASAGVTTLRVDEKRAAADGVVHLRLVDPLGGRLPDWAPGAHIDLILPDGRGVTLTRQYSLCGDRWDPSTYEVAVLREPESRGGSSYVHDTLAVGDLVGVGGPRNNFALAPATHYLFVAGGIGITPILPMIEAAERMAVPWNLVYGGRTRASMAFAGHLVEAYGDRVTIRPQDEHGLLDLEGVLAAAPEGAKVYCCGPGPLLDALGVAATAWPVGSVRTERFVAKDQGTPVRSAPFEVELARTGRTVEVSAGESIIEALDRCGVRVLTSCREGTCGTCVTPVISGVPDHRDSLLTDDERTRSDCMFVCVSRSVSDRLVLDL
jgi:ferredoxin-NADP reductase